MYILRISIRGCFVLKFNSDVRSAPSVFISRLHLVSRPFSVFLDLNIFVRSLRVSSFTAPISIVAGYAAFFHSCDTSRVMRVKRIYVENMACHTFEERGTLNDKSLTECDIKVIKQTLDNPLYKSQIRETRIRFLFAESGHMRMVWANEGGRYICIVFFHWLRPVARATRL